MSRHRAGSNSMRALALGIVVLVSAWAPSTFGTTTSADLLRCQKSFESQIRAFTTLASTRIAGCTEKILRCKLAAEIDGVDPTKCLSAATTRCGAVPQKIAAAETTRLAKVVAKCAPIPLADLEQFVGGLGFFNVVAGCSATSVDDLVACVLAEGRCTTEREVFVLDPRALDSLNAAGIAASFPCVGP